MRLFSRSLEVCAAEALVSDTLMNVTINMTQRWERGRMHIIRTHATLAVS